jgi:hypothetical protein
MATIRIATVKATGKRYVVQQVIFAGDKSKVLCWGEVAGHNGARTTHDAEGKKFLLSAVEIAEVEKTPALCAALFQQMVDARREAGHLMVRKGRNVVDYGTAADREAAAALNAAARAVRSDLASVVRALGL